MNGKQSETPIITSAADLLAAHALGERDFSQRVQLRWGANLSGANLWDADLRGAVDAKEIHREAPNAAAQLRIATGG